ncbi:MAG: recombinase RecT [Nocardiaceae bacterium]|nr:recombinase RecT [Nocardiaceae bacterium]
MSNEIATNSNLADSVEWVRMMAPSDLLPKQFQGKPANLLFAIEYADAVGIPRIHALTSIAVISGKPSPTAELMASLARKAGHILRVVGDDTYCEATLIRADDREFSFQARWDVDKARKAKLWGNAGPWTQYPSAMLRARAISEVIRMGAPDCLAGAVYSQEEMRDVRPVPVRATAADILQATEPARVVSEPVTEAVVDDESMQAALS